MRELWREYEEGGRALFGYALKLTKDPDEARDLVQEATAQAARSWGTFKEGQEVKPWLYTILRNVYLDRRRRAHVKRDLSLEYEIGIARNGVPLLLRDVLEDSQDDPERAAERLDVAGRVQAALGKLSGAHAELLRLVDMDGASYEAAALILGVKLGTVRSRISRARDALRRTLTPVLL